MNHYQKVAILLVRLTAIIVFALGLMGLFYGAALSTYGAPMTDQQSERWIGSFWYIGFGVALFFGSRPLGRFLGRGLE
jgi:hypothetical protein